MADHHFDLLQEPLLSVADAAGAHSQVTLPGLLTRLSAGENLEMALLEPHQQLAWHTFLCQLAAIALHRGEHPLEQQDLAYDDNRWRELLIEAAKADGGTALAFSLVVEDLSQAAFMQPPLTDLHALKSLHDLPTAELDTLITSKNHDVKIDRIARPMPEHWVFALVALQTTSGFLGRGNYGIARMNGGFGSRPRVGFTRSHRYEQQFRRDVEVLLRSLREVSPIFPACNAGSPALLWVQPWDGTASAPLNSLHPLFLEVSRRIRLTRRDDALMAHRGSSDGPRVDAKAALGNTGDPWTPVEKAKGAALTMTEQGFSYRKLSELLGGDWQQGAAGELLASDGAEPLLVAQVLAGGQGKTAGWHERVLLVPEKVRNLFLRPEGRSAVAARARAWVERAKLAEYKVFRPALLCFLQGGPETINLKDDAADSAVTALDREIDRHFFRLLFEQVDTPETEATAAWDEWLFERAKTRLIETFRSAPLSAMRKYRAQSQAIGLLYGAGRKQLNQPRQALASEEI